MLDFSMLVAGMLVCLVCWYAVFLVCCFPGMFFGWYAGMLAFSPVEGELREGGHVGGHLLHVLVGVGDEDKEDDEGDDGDDEDNDAAEHPRVGVAGEEVLLVMRCFWCQFDFVGFGYLQSTL